MGDAQHWDTIYGTKSPDEVSWFQERPATSLRLLTRFANPHGSVIDVGAGESLLASALLDHGWRDVSVLDVSAEAIAAVRRQLAGRDDVSFIVADLLDWTPPRQYDAWHDRAVLHFLVGTDQQERYSELSAAALRGGGVAVVGTFAEDGPTTCSGLVTCRYDVPTLVALCGTEFELLHHEREEHITPAGVVQPFTWVVLRRL